MTNSTTPDSPQQCPTCHSPRRDVRCDVPTETEILLCADPFHTSLPTGEQAQVAPKHVKSCNYERLGRICPGCPACCQAIEQMRSEAAHPSETRAGEQEGSTALEPWMTREAFEWMDAALGLDAGLHPHLADLIPAKGDVSGLERERWQQVVNIIYCCADHADAMPKVLQDLAPRKGPHSLKLRREI